MIRNYEVSVWTLQDSFITVLKPDKLESKGQIENAKMHLVNDGTAELSFTIPMYLGHTENTYWYDESNEAAPTRENPLWQNTVNGVILAGMRKIKVIFNKQTEDEAVFEFVITKVTERHEKDEKWCDVECEGLAFHELGKNGYRLSLTEDTYYNDHRDWQNTEYTESEEAAHMAAEPHNNIEYWLHKIFDGTDWNWSVQMDYANHDGIVYRLDLTNSAIDHAWVDLSNIADEEYHDTKLLTYFDLTKEQQAVVNQRRENMGLWRCDKIYEEEYVTEWVDDDGNIVPGAVEKAKEKERLINCEESNIYNITQDLAEVFGVFCKYKYYYDDNYHITGREVIFYNTFIQDSTGVIDITYPYDTGKITREMDSADVATKLYVKTLENSNTASGLATITDTAINKTLEDYILNFDYLYTIGTITEEQYAEIPKFETDVRKLNLEMLPKEQELDLLQLKLPEAEAAVTVLNNAVALDQERISANDDLLNNLTNGTQILHVTANRPNLSYLVPDKDVKEGEQPYKIILREKGIIKDTVHVYKTWELSSAKTTENTEGTENTESTETADTETEVTATETETTDNESTSTETEEEEEIGRYTLSDEVTYSPRFDADGNLIALVNLAKSDDESSLRYITYDYRPALYYDNIKESWVRRLNDDEANRVKAQAELEAIQNRIEILKAELEALMIQKDKLLKYFNRLMGPALREANWQPEDEYGKFGAKYNTKLSFSDFNKDTLIQLYWDDVGFDDEQKNTYVIGAAEQVTRHYPCVELTQEFIKNFHDGGYTNLSDICFIFTDVNAEQTSGSVTNPENTTIPTVDELKYYRYYAIGSQSQLAFVRSKLTGTIKPVLMLTGIETVNIYNGSQEEDEEVIIKQPTQEQLETFLSHNAQIGHIVPVYDAEHTQFNYEIKTVQAFNGFLDTEEYDTIVFPRIRVNSLNLKTNSDELNVALPPSVDKSNIILSEYVDYYIMPRENEYYITLRPDIFYMKAQKLPDNNFSVNLNCLIADAASGIYLDALQIARENAYPKVEYTVDISMAKPDFMRVAYSTMNKIVHINDNELKFNHVQGYISDLDLDLDHPWQDKLGIKNYKTKFEDLFVDIVAQTEAMKKNSQIAEIGGQIFAPTGMLTKESLQEAFDGYNLQYEFNNGKLMIDDKNGILAASDEGVVAYRGGGIFTATEQDDDGNWVWNTGILPSGINADLIRTGRLDTNLINIYAGDNLKLQMNGTGLYAFKSWSDMVDFANENVAGEILDNLDEPPSDAALSYVVFNEEGLFLTMNDGAPYIDKDGAVQTLDLKALETPVDKVNRVEISWRGLILRNNANEDVFYADPDTGNLTIAGEIQATSGQIGPWMVGSRSLYQTLDTKIEDDQEEEVVPFATKNTIYLGEEGLSISDLFQLKTEVVQSTEMGSTEIKRILSDFSINEYLLDPNNKEKTILSPIFQIKNTQTAADPAYQVIINSDVQFGNNFVLPIKNGGTGSNDGTGLYYKVNSQDNLPSNAKDGDLGVVLNTSNEIRYSDVPFTARQPSGSYYGPFDFNTVTSSFTKNHKNGTYCGVSALCWNTHLTTNEVSAGYSMPEGNNYARLGWINNNDDKFNSAIWLPFDCPEQIDKNTILKINFKVKNRFWGSWNASGTANGIHQINTTSVDNNYGIKIIGSDWQTVVASGTFNIRRGSDDEGVYDDSPYTVQERTCICQLNNNLSGNCVLLFYSDAGSNSNSLTYLDCSKIEIYKALPNLNMPQLFLYSKRDSKWMQLAFASTSEP